MKKFLTLLIMLFLIAGSTLGQQFTVVPTGGTAGNTNGTGGDPVCRYYNSIRYQVVYTVAELSAAGMPANFDITALAWNVTESSVSLGNYTIKMGHTTATNSAAHNTDATVTVKNPFTYSVTTGYNDIVFDNAFMWNGTSNIVVEICTGPSNPYTSPYGGVQVKTGVTSGSRMYRVDGASACAVNTGTTNTTKPYVRFTGTPSNACSGTPTPGNTISSANPVCIGVNFSLTLENSTSGAGVTYQWQSSPDGNDPWTDLGTASTQVASQTAPTYYRCHVTCDGNTGTSNPLLVPMYLGAIPYVEEFITTTTPSCWNITGWIIGSTRGVTGNPGNNIYKNLWSSATTGTFTTGLIGPVSAGDLLTFDYKLANYSSPYGPPAVGSGNYVVSVSTDGTNFTPLETVANNGVAGWQSKSYDLTAYAGSNILIRIVGTRTSGDYDLAFDNIEVAPPPTSPIFSVSPITYNFGQIDLNTTSASQSFTISNTGTGVLDVSAVALTGTDAAEFTITNQASIPASLSLGQTAVVQVAFAPLTQGAKTANLEITYNDGSVNTYNVVLTGVGYVAPQGSFCSNPIPITLPVVAYAGTTEGFGDEYNSTDITPNSSYLNGDDIVFEFTLTDASYLTGSVAGSWTGLLITQNCPNPVTPAALLASGTGSAGGSFSNVLLPAGTYFAIISTYPSPQFTTFTFDLSAVAAPPCLPPSALSATNITQNSADLSWAQIGTPVSWDIELGVTGFTPTGTPTQAGVANPYTYGGLAASTTYQYYVRAFCGGTDYSTWAGPYAFTTACAVFTAPFYEPFTTSTIPICWSMSGPQSWLFTTTWSDYGADNLADHTPGGGTYYAGVDGSGAASLTGITLLSPFIDVTPLTNPRLKFFLFNNNISDASYQTLTVDVYDGAAWNNAAFVWGPTQNAATWQEVIVPLNAYTITGPVQFRFVVEKSAGSPYYDDIIIDDVIVEETPACPYPTALTASNFTATSADLAWTEGGTATSWDIELGTTGFTPTGVPTQAGVTNPYTYGGLTAATSYQYYVRADCGTSQSPWVGPYAFSTIICAPANQCNYTFNMFDTYGDGWNGATMQVRQNGIVVATIGTGFTTGTSATQTVALCDGIGFDVFWNAGGSYASECGLQIVDPFSTVLYNQQPIGSGLVGTVLYTGTTSCTPPACPNPTALAAANFTLNSADLSWTQSGTAVSWDIELGLNGFTPTGTPTQAGVTNPYTYGGLASATTYQYYVRAFCGGTEYSDWAGPFAFSTACDVFTLPLSENFDATPVLTIPTCWTAITNTSSWVVNNNVASLSAPNAILNYYNATLPKNDWFFSPGVVLTQGVEYTVSFAVQAPGWAGVGESMEVLVGTSPTVGGMTSGTIYTNSNMQFTSFTGITGTFTPTVTGTYYVGWHANSVADLDYIAVDNISIYETPACALPTSLTATNVTINSADLGWTGGTLWNVEIGLPGFTPGNGEEEDGVIGTTSNPWSVSNLTSGTLYEFYVQSDCGVNGVSTWAGPYSFSTLCDAFNIPYTMDFEAGATCWTVQNIDGAGASWQLYTNNHTPGGGIGAGHIWGATGYLEQGAIFTPDIILPAAADLEFSFWSFSVDAAFTDVNALLVSTDGFTTYDVIWQSTSTTEATWEQNIIDISLYAGNTVNFAFLYEGTEANGWVIDDIEIYEVIPQFKTLDLNVFIEGLYISPGTMREAQGDTGPQFGAGIADEVILELYDPLDLLTPVYQNLNVQISTTGVGQVTDIPAALEAEYYVVIKHRNSIETWSGMPYSLLGTGPFSYDFTSAASQAYGNNQKSVSGGFYAIWGGNANLDGIVDIDDMTMIDNASQAPALEGYNPQDLNGDGIVDIDDMSIIDNNSQAPAKEVMKP